MKGPAYVLTASVTTEEPAQVAQVAEVLARAAAGLALEGITVNVSIVQVLDDDEEENVHRGETP